MTDIKIEEKQKQIRQVKAAITKLNTALPKLYEMGVVCWISTKGITTHPISPVISVTAELKGIGLNQPADNSPLNKK